MKPICIIPARAGSKGVKGKNIRKLNGKPLISYAIESALNSNLFTHVFVSTEDPKISKISKKYGAEIPFLRPKNLAKDNSDIIDTLYYTIKKLKKILMPIENIIQRKIFGLRKIHNYFRKISLVYLL